MGRDGVQRAAFNGGTISTHTPAWGVTFTWDLSCQLHRISTHTPAWGVTGVWDKITSIFSNFNSHARVGRDLSPVTSEHTSEDFNSHARVGRDSPVVCLRRCDNHFNSHARVGRDGILCQCAAGTYRFQLTRPRGA